MVLSVSDYAYFAKLSYSNDKQNVLNDKLFQEGKEGWEVVDINGGVNGLQAIAFGRGKGADGKYAEIVIAYRGTDSLFDTTIDDLQIAVGSIPSQTAGAINYYDTIVKNLSENGSISVTGHSLGGALAQLVAAITGDDAYTFNAPGMKYLLSQLGLDEQEEYTNIENYIVMNDYVGNFREHIGQEYYYEPLPIENVPLQDTHSGIFDERNDIEDYFTLPASFGTSEGLSLWYYDTRNNLKLDSNVISYVTGYVSIDSLENAIEIIRSEIGETKKFLSYTTDDGMYILDSKNDSHSIITESGNDIIFANSGSDLVNSGSGNDIVVGGSGADTIHGGDGNDVLIAGSVDNISIKAIKRLLEYKQQIIQVKQYETGDKSRNYLYGGSGDDLLIGDKGNDYLSGGEGNDIIYGGDGTDILVAGSGNDTLNGGLGADTLCNYSGRAYLNGGKGDDRYYVNSGTTNVIKDDDGHGLIIYDNYKRIYGASEDYYLENDEWEYDGVHYRIDSVSGALYISPAGGGTTIIPKFQQGEVSIILIKPEQEPDPEPEDDEPTDPIILDLTGNGLQAGRVENGLHIDYNNDGFAEKISWAGEGNGVLVIDSNNNGIVDNANEILTSETLSSYDTNNDGKIDYQDENFNNLRISDSNGNLTTLDENGISSINTTVTGVNIVDEHGNVRFAEGTYTKTDGTEMQYGEYKLVTNYKDTTETELLEETETVSNLPDITGSGKLHSLRQAMLRDNSLLELVQNYVNENNEDLIEQIIFKWVGCENIDENSRGTNINAKHLAVWEAINGKSFLSTHEGEANPSNPNKEASDIIETVYNQFKLKVYAELAKSSHLSSYYDAIVVKDNLKCDLTQLTNLLKAAMNENANEGKKLIYQVTKMLKGLGLDTSSNFFDPFDDECFYTSFTKNDRELKWQLDTIGKTYTEPNVVDGTDNGTSGADAMRDTDESISHNYHSFDGDDVLYGGNNDDYFAGCNGHDILDGGNGDDHLLGNGASDWLFGGNGNDTILGGADNDIIFGGDGDDVIYPDIEGEGSGWVAGTGNDTIRGGTGNDYIYSHFGDETYIFNLGDGHDTITDLNGTDTIYFGNGISWNDITFEKSEDDMIISINNPTDKITIKNWYLTNGKEYDNNFRIEKFEFADGSLHYQNEIPLENMASGFEYVGGDGDEYFETSDNYINYVNGGAGNDYVNADSNSNDIYIYNIGDGYDWVNDYSGNNEVRLGEGITADKLHFEQEENKFYFWIDGIEGGMNFGGYVNPINKFVFADGTELTDITDKLNSAVSFSDCEMNENLTKMTLLGYESVTVQGNNLDNEIYGNYGNTTFNAGLGNDKLQSLNFADDKYIFNIGDGRDYILDKGGNDTIEFGEGITAENVKFRKNVSNNNLEISFNIDGAWNDSIAIENHFGNEENRIEKLKFADGTEISDVENRITGLIYENQSGDIAIPENIQDIDVRGYENNKIIGNSMNNNISGCYGDTVYEAGAGDDEIFDGGGSSDRYIYNLGDGNDYYSDYKGLDAIIFGENITASGTYFHRDYQNNGLRISFADHEGSIYIENYFGDDSRRVELFKFADGTVIDNLAPYLEENNNEEQYGSIVIEAGESSVTFQGSGNAFVLGNSEDNFIYGNSGNNVYAGCGGNDTINDEAGGDDVYYYTLGGGQDAIIDKGGNDCIRLGSNIWRHNIFLAKDDNALCVLFKNDDGSFRDEQIRILNYFNNDEYKIERIELDDGTIIENLGEHLDYTDESAASELCGIDYNVLKQETTAWSNSCREGFYIENAKEENVVPIVNAFIEKQQEKYYA